MRARPLTLGVALALLGLLSAALVLALPDPGPGPTDSPRSPGSAPRYAYLASQRSNRCDLSAAEVRAMTEKGRLQGSCCTPMDEARYRHQVAALARYGGEPMIPRDPYDVPVGLVTRLLRADAQIHLGSAQRLAYRRAMEMSSTGGPCCCRCWRWEAFRGLSKYLLAGRRWPPDRLGSLIGDLDGCGGPAEAETSKG